MYALNKIFNSAAVNLKRFLIYYIKFSCTDQNQISSVFQKGFQNFNCIGVHLCNCKHTLQPTIVIIKIKTKKKNSQQQLVQNFKAKFYLRRKYEIFLKCLSLFRGRSTFVCLTVF